MDSTAREDRKITCKECKQPFIFTAGEQAFYEEKQLHDPLRCKDCRDRRKAETRSQGN